MAKKSKNDNRVDSFIWHLRVSKNIHQNWLDLEYIQKYAIAGSTEFDYIVKPYALFY